MRGTLIGSLIAVAALAAGCGSDRADCEDPPGASGRFPGDTLEDWRAHADHLVVFSVVKVVDPPGSALPVATSRVDRVLWSAPEAPPPPEELPLRVFEDRFERGDVVLSPMVRIDDHPPPHWSMLTYCA